MKKKFREEKCRGIFQKIFSGQMFPCVRPNWLRNHRTGRNLELDGFCENLNLGFEFDGIQQFKFPNRFHKDLSDFHRQRKRDRMKNIICKSQNIILIRIRYDVINLELFIRSELKKNGFVI